VASRRYKPLAFRKDFALASTAPADLFALFENLGIAARTYEHAPVFTVAESQAIKHAIPGGHSKNLFLKDKKGRLFLVVAHTQTRIDLKRLHAALGASGRLSFGSSDLLAEVLGVEPGSVTPFALVNDRGGRVSVVLDEELMRHEPVNFHPLVNCATTGVSRADLLRFLRATGHEPRIMGLPEPAGENCESSAASPSSG
jgi:Ala-tRNA(Pro) deacylase